MTFLMRFLTQIIKALMENFTKFYASTLLIRRVTTYFVTIRKIRTFSILRNQLNCHCEKNIVTLNTFKIFYNMHC
jgi:hypothetical protein